jgi:hypothetical protein
MKRKRREDYQPCTVPFDGDLIAWVKLVMLAAWEVGRKKAAEARKPKN